MLRLNKYIANSGYCSRRKAEEYILAGKVRINGKIVEELGTMVNEEKDKVVINGKNIYLEDDNVYIMLNKPIGYVTTNNEQFGRKSTSDIVKVKKRVFPIGRLDMNTEGLLLFTNDGDFANKLTHPSHSITKTYIVKVKGELTDEKIEILRSGVDIGDYVTKEATVDKIEDDKLKIVISEGKNRQIRRMCEALNLKVLALKRTKIGNLELGELQLRKYRFLKKSELKKIFEK